MMNRMKKNLSNVHEFALFYENLGTIIEKKKQGDACTIHDELLVHRLKNVLRMQVDERCVLFSRELHANVRVHEIGKKHIQIELLAIEQNAQIKPAITVLLPLLKREAFNEALYACVELGANFIQLVMTQKVQRSWTDHEFNHAHKIMIAAAEQSKNFAFPLLHTPVQLAEIVENNAFEQKIFFDPQGKPLLDVLNQLHETKPHLLGLMIGPEGDLSPDEKELLQHKGFIFCALTPTVLRAQQALVLGLGSIRATIS